MVFKLERKTVKLRILRESDVLLICENANNRIISKYCLLSYPYTKKDAKQLIHRSKLGFKSKTEYIFGIISKDINKLAGVIIIDRISIKNKNCKIAVWVGKKYWRKGCASEALSIIEDFCFRKLKFKKVWAYVNAKNIAIISMSNKLGWKLEGIFRKQLFINNRWYDQLRFGLLKSEYKRNLKEL